MEFRLLGPLQVVRDNAEVPVNAAKQRVLLAALALHAGRLLPADELIDRIWGPTPPAGARNTLRTYVMRLRKALGDASVIETMLDGYRLTGDTDVQRFNSLIADSPDLTRLDEALALWRGAPADGLLPAEVQTLADRRLEALIRRCELAVEQGRHDEAVPALRDLVAQHPLRENLWALLMRALHAAGRRAEALTAYDEARAILSDQLGIDPGSLLQSLRAELAGGVNPAEPPTPRPRPVFQLPPAVGNFVGRAPELDRIRTALMPGPAMRIMTISGPPGVGKTALAVRAAHMLRDQFPDGQLFINLRGHAQSSPVRAVDALARFLRALGVKPEDIPIDEDELTARYRTELADRRVLVVLDNAVSLHQVQRLFPGSAGCAVVITSRNQLRSLVASHGAAILLLNVFTATESAELIERSLGPQTERLSATLGQLCSHLPLALRLAIANMANMTAREIESYLAELMRGRQLTSLDIADDHALALRTTFDLSYQVLTPAAQRLFRLLAAVPGPDFTADAAAALVEVDAAEAHRLLAELQVASLTQSAAGGRWQLHDLLKLYAQELLVDAAEAEAARLRLLAWYLHSADAAVAQLTPHMVRGALEPLPDGVTVPALPDARTALHWLGAEHQNLVAAAVHADENGPREFCWQLANALRGYLRSRGHRVDWLTLSEAGMRAAVAAGNTVAQAVMHNCLGTIYEITDNDRSIHHFTQALAVGGDDIEPDLRAAALNNLGTQYKEIGRLDDSIAHYERALAIATQFCTPTVVAIVVGGLGTALLMAGRLTAAREQFERAAQDCFALKLNESSGIQVGNLAITALEMGDTGTCLDHAATAHEIFERHEYGYGLAGVFTVIASARYELGDLAEAAAAAENAVELARSANADRYESDALAVLSTISTRRGNVPAALDQGRHALKIAVDIRQARAEIEACLALAQAHQADGDLPAAQEHARRALRTTNQAGIGQREARCHTVLAMTLVEHNGSPEAAVHAEQAVRIARAHGQPIDEGRALIVLAKAYADHRSADCLRQAETVLDRIAHPGAAEARELLTGISPRGR
ncbi:BTAD domain-containing putative transcriptional regulator [Kutzneria buriramensis]|uniref:DNA-binding SARP family transcriptional activator n=1 Tax=Kutzneria buriramensis TaxID=1045776 RepID=A0A3E0IA46_9PSEU|nr:BTAD domain-containing putative transcriptional regulator [Kutzneria buriramensis]REH55519.1 DNA-binding SARP family transcriptional activator [Kutzneria buriramensis]